MIFKILEESPLVIKVLEVGDEVISLKDGITEYRGGIGNELLKTIEVKNGRIVSIK